MSWLTVKIHHLSDIRRTTVPVSQFTATRGEGKDPRIKKKEPNEKKNER